MLLIYLLGIAVSGRAVGHTDSDGLLVLDVVVYVVSWLGVVTVLSDRPTDE